MSLIQKVFLFTILIFIGIGSIYIWQSESDLVLGTKERITRPFRPVSKDMLLLRQIKNELKLGLPIRTQEIDEGCYESEFKKTRFCNRLMFVKYPANEKNVYCY